MSVGPYGTWSSPISAADVAAGGVGVGEPWLEGDVAYWLERRPADQGRAVLVRAEPFGSPVDVTPNGFDARTRVHEYGGGSYLVRGDVVVFSNDDDQRLYRQDAGGEPRPITPEPPSRASIRYADGRMTLDGARLICVRERHEPDRVLNELVTLPADGSEEPVVVASGADFYAAPRVSADGRRIAFIAWRQPRMPWDGTELHVADLGTDATLSGDRVVAGGERESIFQPEWSPTGVLHFVSDRTGWWNVYRLDGDGRAEHLTPLDAEFGVPMWELGYATYAFLDDGRIVCTYRTRGVQHLAAIDPTTLELLDLDVPFPSFEPYLRTSGSRLLFVAGGSAIPHEVVSLDFTARSVDVLRVEREIPFDDAYVSAPEPLEFPTESGRARTRTSIRRRTRTRRRRRANGRRSS